MKTVVLDPGHCILKEGACANGYKESEICWRICTFISNELKRHKVNVYLSRKYYDCPELSKRAETASKYNADCLVSVHLNSGGGHGIECFRSIKTSDKKDGRILAENVTAALGRLGLYNRGVKTRLNGAGNDDYYGIIRYCKKPVILCECLFIDNKNDCEFINTDEKIKKLGNATAHGILNFLQIQIKNEKTKEELEEMKALEKCKELEEKVTKLEARIKKLENPMIYNYIDGNMPEWARATIEKLFKNKMLKGNEKGELGLTDDMLRMFVILDRAGIYEK